MVPAYKASVHMHRKDVIKKVKKKIKLGDYILTYKRLLLILCSAEKKKNSSWRAQTGFIECHLGMWIFLDLYQ